MNKPIYVGFCVLKLSKTLLYSFHYEKMPKMLNPSQYQLLYTDTDSLIYWIHCPNIYDIVKNHYEFFDTSAFKPGNRYGIEPRNKLVVGLMKDEATGEIITEFVGLRYKMYSIRLNGEDYVKRCKGIKQAIVKRTLSFEDYKTSFDQDCIISRKQRNFVSRLHGVNTVEQTKIALNPIDDKRCLVENYKTLPWGHCHIFEEEEMEERGEN